jgi:hypothetical protein
MTETITTEQNNTVVASSSQPQTIVTQTTAVQTIVTGMMAPTSAINMSQLRDIDVTELSAGAVLVYNAQTEKWTSTRLLDQQIFEAGQF